MPDQLGTGVALGAGRLFGAGSLTLGWSTKSAVSPVRASAAAATIGAVVYLAGGSTTSPIANVDAFDHASGTWTAKASLPGARHQGQMAEVGGKLYFHGGMSSNSSGYQNAMWEYDPLANTWTTKTPGPRPRASGGAAVVNGLIYFIGGLDNGTLTAWIDSYDPATDTWATMAATLPTPRQYVAVTDGGDGFIYICGGFAGSAQSLHHRYDPATDTIVTRTAMPTTARYGHTYVRKGALLYAIGGFTPSYSNLNSAFDPSTNTWSAKATMTTARYLLSGASAPGGVYAIGGHNGSYLGTNQYFRVPEIEGQGSITGRAVMIPYPSGIGAIVGQGVADGDGDAVFSGQSMQLGPVPIGLLDP